MFPSFNPRARFREIMLAAGVLASAGALDVGQRMPTLIGQSQAPGATFARCKVVVVGLGSVGRVIALHLARLGVEVLWLIDPDRFNDRANLVTQQIQPDDLGQAKVSSAGKACKAISPATRVRTYEGKFQDLDPALMADADMVFVATDNLVAEVDLANLFRLLGIPLLQASVHGESLVAQIRLIENRVAAGPCLGCLFGLAERRHMNQSSVFSCSGQNGRADEHVIVMPTMSTSFLCSLAADFALTQWTRFVLDLGAPVADTLLQYCGFTHRLTQAPVGRNPECRGSHMILERRPLPVPLPRCTLGQLVEAAGVERQDASGVSFTLGALSYVESAVCRCDQRAVDRFLPPGKTLGRCPKCGDQRVAEPFVTHRPTPASVVDKHFDQPLKELGAGAARWAVVQRGEYGVLLQ